MSSTILITGSTGLVGKALVKMCLSQGHIVHYLTTQKSKIILTENCKGFFWNPQVDLIDICCFEGVEVVINLAGSSIAQRWTNTAKSSILSSRKQALELLYSIIKENKFQIKHIISASAIGIYPHSKTHYYNEDFNGNDTSFLRKVVRSWEGALKSFKSLGINTTILRIGIVLDKHEGALPKISVPVKAYIGSALGSGEQWQSWIHIDDLIRIFMFVLDLKLYGVYNAVAPNPVQQTDFVKSVASIFNRTLIFPKIPEFLLRFVLGEMSALALESQRVCAKKIQDLGFEFNFHELDAALDDLL